MTNRVSPFAALTGAEKQIKWLEYQSVRLPYIQSGMEDVPDTPAAAPQSSPAPSPTKREPVSYTHLTLPTILLV